MIDSTRKCSFVDRGHPPLLVFADDWGRHPSSCQHLVRRLAAHYPIFWVNTIGTRKPGFNLTTLWRGLGKLRQWLNPSPSQPPGLGDRNPVVLNPRMWPWFSSAFDRWVNRRFLVKQITAALSALPRPPIAITTIPVVADLVGELSVNRWVYYCVDDFSVWPGLDGGMLRSMEDRLLRRMDRVIAVSETLRKKLAEKGWEAPLLTHGVDLDHWQSASASLPPGYLDGFPRPLAVFWGVIDRRLDLAYLERLSTALKEGTILLVGPTDNPDGRLAKLERVAIRRPLPYDSLPALAREAAVLIMPYGDLPVTRAMQPLKLKEYLATGKPAVVRALPAVEPWADCLDIAHTPDSFAASVVKRLAEGLPTGQNLARGRLIEENWAAKAERFAELAFEDQIPNPVLVQS